MIHSLVTKMLVYNFKCHVFRTGKQYKLQGQNTATVTEHKKGYLKRTLENASFFNHDLKTLN